MQELVPTKYSQLRVQNIRTLNSYIESIMRAWCTHLKIPKHLEFTQEIARTSAHNLLKSNQKKWLHGALIGGHNKLAPLGPITVMSEGVLGIYSGVRHTYLHKHKHSLRMGWRNFFPVVLLCQFLVLAGNRFWFYILMYLEYNTVVVLCQLLVLAGNSFWCYVCTQCTIQLCGCVSFLVVVGNSVVARNSSQNENTL